MKLYTMTSWYWGASTLLRTSDRDRETAVKVLDAISRKSTGALQRRATEALSKFGEQENEPARAS